MAFFIPVYIIKEYFCWMKFCYWLFPFTKSGSCAPPLSFLLDTVALCVLLFVQSGTLCPKQISNVPSRILGLQARATDSSYLPYLFCMLQQKWSLQLFFKQINKLIIFSLFLRLIHLFLQCNHISIVLGWIDSCLHSVLSLFPLIIMSLNHYF